MRHCPFLACLLSCAAACLFPPAAPAAPIPARVFSDHMVLQRDMRAPVWGWAAPGEKVTVGFKGQTVSATADSGGRWRVDLAPLPASAEPAQMRITGDRDADGGSVVISDIVVGDVWLCSGQSNMEWQVSRSDNAAAEIAAADFPLIRHFEVSREPVTMEPKKTYDKWMVCSPATAGDFTGIGYYFARDIFRRHNVPVGLVNSSWGGTGIETWMSEHAILADRSFRITFYKWIEEITAYPERLAAYDRALANWKSDAAKAGAAGKKFTKQPPRPPESLYGQNKPARLFSAMIAPVIPCALKGAVWYQGEHNAGRPDGYGALLSAMLRDWRARWGQGDFPFVIMQLPNYKSGDASSIKWARLREEQERVAKTEPNTELVVMIDLGNPDDVHPTNKLEAGLRLARTVRARVYGEPLEYMGPAFARAEAEGAGMRVHFSHADGLHAKGGGPAPGFEIAGADREFVEAPARIEGATVYISSPKVAKPVAVRYAWRNAPETDLYNKAGLPAAPFRTDDW
jgi:sialate O-acetylesterase